MTLAKKQLLFADAERLYIIDHCTLGEIASRLRIHEKTVANWKEEGDWENKRKNILIPDKHFMRSCTNLLESLCDPLKTILMLEIK